MRITLIALILVSTLSGAPEFETIKMQCQGSYSNFQKSDLRSVPISGIYIEISEDQVKILGAPGFDSMYSIVTRKETGIGFQIASNTSYGGFLDRFTGQLSLMQEGPAKSDGS